MATIVQDIAISQSNITETADGYRVERVAIIYGLTGDADQVLYNAVNDVSMPAIGDAHPEISSITLRSKRAEFIKDGDACKVTLTYFDEPGSGTGATNSTIRGSANSVSEESKFDAYRNRLIAKFARSSGDDSEGYTAQVDQPRTTFDVSWTQSTFPRALLDQYQSAVNDDDWNGYAAKTVLVQGISVSEEGDNYEVSMSFAVNPDTWQFVARIPLGATGAHSTDPDSAIDLTTNRKPFDIYRPVDFNALSITLPGAYCTLTGTITASDMDEADIRTGGKTIILTLTNDTWVTAGATFDAQRQNIIDGITSNQSETNGWTARQANIMQVADVVRTSNTVVTITLDADATYNITITEELDILVPATALTTSDIDMKVSKRVKILTV